MDITSIFALALSCTTTAAPSLVAATAVIMTNGNELAITVNGDPVTATTRKLAIAEASTAFQGGADVRIGLGQTTPAELEAAGVSLSGGFSACTSLAVLDTVLTQTSKGMHGTADERWLAAASLRATGTYDLTLAADFVAKVADIRSGLPLAASSETSGQIGKSEQAASFEAPQAEASASAGAQGDQTTNSADVYATPQGKSLLVFSQE